MTAEADYKIHSARELSGAVPISNRKDLAKEQRNATKKRKRDKLKKARKQAQPDAEAPNEVPAEKDDRKHKVNYLA